MIAVRIADIADVVRGVSWDKNEASDVPREGYLPILRAGNISDVLNTDDDLVWVPSSNVSAIQRIRAGDIAICMSSGSASVVGKTAFSKIDWPGSVGAFCALLRADANQCLPEYLGFYLKSSNFRRWTSEAQGANIKNIRKSALEDFAIPLPSLPEQRRIVDLLSRAEGIVRLRREAEKKAAELIPALFLDMFGDPATNPKGWDCKNLGDFCRIIGGSSLPPGEPFCGQSDGMLLMKVSDMNSSGNEVNIVSCKEWIVEQARSYSKVATGIIVFPKRGAAIATNKKRITTRPTLLDPNLMGVESNQQVARTAYLYQWFSAFDLADISSGTTVPQLNKGDLTPLIVPIPPRPLQNAFEEKRSSVLSIQSQQAVATAKAEATFAALLAQVFSGNTTRQGLTV